MLNPACPRGAGERLELSSGRIHIIYCLALAGCGRGALWLRVLSDLNLAIYNILKTDLWFFGLGCFCFFFLFYLLKPFRAPRFGSFAVRGREVSSNNKASAL